MLYYIYNTQKWRHNHCQMSQSHLPEARGPKQKFDNDYDVIFMCYKYNIS